MKQLRTATLKAWTIFILSIVGLANANAQFLENTEKIDIVQIPGFDDGGAISQYYVADLGTASDLIAWTTSTTDAAK